MKPFESLTDRGQARRLRVLAGSALRAFGREHASLRLIDHWGNTTFRVDVPGETKPWRAGDRAVPGRYLLRLHRPMERTAAHVAAEIAWLEDLSRDGRVAVPRPLHTTEGQPAFVVANADHPALGGGAGQRVCSMLRWMPGRMLGKPSQRLHHIHEVGRVMATLHDHAAAWRPTRRLDRPRWDARAIMGRDASVGVEPDVWDELPDDELDLHTACEARLNEACAALGEGPDAFGLIHADLHFSNVLFVGRRARPIDFDDCGFGHFLYDMAATLTAFDDAPGDRPWRDALIDGYRGVRAFDDDLLGPLNVFEAARLSSLLLWCRSSARTHPGFRDMLPRWREQSLPHIRLRLGVR